MRHASATTTESVISITDARSPHSDDVDRRTKRYLISMAIRTVCFVLAVVTPSPWRWGFAVGAIFLPYVAVIMGNAGYQRRVVMNAPQDPSDLGSDPDPDPVMTQAAATERQPADIVGEWTAQDTDPQQGPVSEGRAP